MNVYSGVLTATGPLLAATLLFRAARGGFLSRFPFFYSYIIYILASGVFVLSVGHYRPESYPTVYWFRFMMTLLAEFAVLVEVSDRIFQPYPALRRLGRGLALFVCAVFFFSYILPSFLEPRPSSVVILDLVKKTSLTKAAIILSLLVATRYFRLPLAKNTSGILVGFSIYLATNAANFTLAEYYGKALYGQTFSAILRVSFGICLLVWTIALWRDEPFRAGDRDAQVGKEEAAVPLGYQLGRFNTVLSRLLGK